MSSAHPKQRTPVTIIAGYLGAGKTTLINQVLTADHGRRLAVLVNDFGSVNIDADLIERHDGQTISLTNGCICCSIADSLAESLDEVLALDPKPDQIVIEASGVADPLKVASYGQGWPGCRLDAVVVLADASTIRAQSRDQFVGELVVRQLSRADLVVATKCDLIDGDEQAAVLDWLGSVAIAPAIAASPGSIDPAIALDLQVEQRADNAGSLRPFGADDLFDSAQVEVPAGLSVQDLASRLDRWPAAIIRVKGIVNLMTEHGTVAAHVVQRVGRRTSIEPTGAAASKRLLIVIGRRGALHSEALAEALR